MSHFQGDPSKACLSDMATASRSDTVSSAAMRRRINSTSPTPKGVLSFGGGSSRLGVLAGATCWERAVLMMLSHRPRNVLLFRLLTFVAARSIARGEMPLLSTKGREETVAPRARGEAMTLM